MKSILKHLWYSWQANGGAPWSAEKRRRSDKLTKYEDALRGSLTETQRAALEACEENLGEMECFTDREVFLAGIRFTVRFLLEAVADD